jgi:hypothetical protein
MLQGCIVVLQPTTAEAPSATAMAVLRPATTEAACGGGGCNGNGESWDGGGDGFPATGDC